METINVTPNVNGLLRWLREVYKTDSTGAIRILRAGWPELCDADAVCVLEGWNELADMLAARR